ncbi:rod-determining factor RdfA (plasmid) [Haloarcula salina]|uniref:rod-determining factor RdfA n=1 Tax=Haloarcula salina TaxID=1429914 RepID=UPI003C702D3A
MADSGCKIETIIDQYGLSSADPVYPSLNEGLLARWTGADGRSAEGYRSLTAWFNKRLLKRVYDDHGRESLDARVESDYETLRGDDDLRREELIESLRADGIPGADVVDDMVSWGTMRTHLNDCLDGEKATQSAATDWERDSVETAKDVARNKTESALSSLSTKGQVDGGDDADIEVQIQLGCPDCPTRVPFDVALERGYVCEQHRRQLSSSQP